ELVGDVGISIVPGEFGLTKTAPGSAIDLSAIAKGYGVDAIGRLLDDVGLTNWLVEIGGEVRVHGPSGRGDPWRVGIDEPISSERSVRRVVGLPVGDLAALATSGDYRNFFEEDGVRYSHVIDPRTGRPARTDLVSASVLAHDCMTADAFATACLVVGPDDAYDLLIERGLEGCLIVATDDGFETRTTPGFPAKLSPPSPPTP
ncbi:MAG: FAD:protein FMN transferase, partial [Planctomycetota bacterium]